jgi:hypothetical protein
MAGVAQKACSDHAIHVDHNPGQDRWDVVDAEGRVVGHCHDLGEATDLAIREAHHIYARGDNVVVCVEQPDGGYRLAWAPHRS